VTCVYVRQWLELPRIFERLGLRVLADERPATDPLIAFGGQACISPAPIARIADVVALGDGELTAVGLADAVGRMGQKHRVLEWAACQQGYYVHGETGELHRIETPAIVPRLMSRSVRGGTPVIEIARGCRSKCGFCSIGWAGGTYREADPGAVAHEIAKAPRGALNLYAPDYSSVSGIDAIDRAISVARCRQTGTDARLDRAAAQARRAGITRNLSVGLEGVSERLRRAVGKPMGHDEIVGALRDVQAAGTKILKLYFIGGLPGEAAADWGELRQLLTELRGVDLHLTITTTLLQPTPHTPLERVDGRWNRDAHDHAIDLREWLAAEHRRDGRTILASQPKGRELHEHDTWLQRAGFETADYLTTALPSRVKSGRWRRRASDVTSALAPIPDDAPTNWDWVQAGLPKRARLAGMRKYNRHIEEASS
jgi:radical SAM superfamily enzyme YgiQ (UPF0313 family)